MWLGKGNFNQWNFTGEISLKISREMVCANQVEKCHVELQLILTSIYFLLSAFIVIRVDLLPLDDESLPRMQRHCWYRPSMYLLPPGRTSVVWNTCRTWTIRPGRHLPRLRWRKTRYMWVRLYTAKCVFMESLICIGWPGSLCILAPALDVLLSTMALCTSSPLTSPYSALNIVHSSPRFLIFGYGASNPAVSRSRGIRVAEATGITSAVKRILSIDPTSSSWVVKNAGLPF